MRAMKKVSGGVSHGAKNQAIRWFKNNENDLYRLAVKRHALKQGKPAIYGLSGYEEENVTYLSGIGDFFNTLAETVKQIAEPVIAYKSQKDILKAQLKRGEQNLPPLNVADYSPVIRIQPQIGEDSEAALTRIATQTTGNVVQKYGVYIAVGVLGLVLLLRKKNRR